MTHPFDTSYDVSFISSPVLADSRKIADYALDHKTFSTGFSAPIQGHPEDNGPETLDLGSGIGLLPELVKSYPWEETTEYSLTLTLFFGGSAVRDESGFYGYTLTLISDPEHDKSPEDVKAWVRSSINDFIGDYMPAFEVIASTPRNEMTLERGLDLLNHQKLPYRDWAKEAA